MSFKPLYLVASCLIILSGILAYDSLTSMVNPYLAVSQVSLNSAYLNKEVQVLATVTDWSPGAGGALRINLTDGKENLEAIYSGIPPQGLRKGQKIVAIGIITPSYRLNATQLLVKCPSKYGWLGRSQRLR